MSRKRNGDRTVIVVLLVLVILAAGLLGGMIWFVNTHFFVGGRPYSDNAQALDLRDRKISVKEYNTIRQQLPDCEIRWNIPFQGSSYPDDTAALKVSSLSQADLDVLAYFEQLQTVDAAGCRDYDMIWELQVRYPNVDVDYTVVIGGEEHHRDAQAVTVTELTDEEIMLMGYLPELAAVDASGCRNYGQIGKLAAQNPGLQISYQVELLGNTYTEADTALTFRASDVAALTEGLAWLPNIQTVHLTESAADAASLRQLKETYPNVTITWDKTVFGKTFNSAETVYDLTGSNIDDVTYSEWAYPKDADETADIIQSVEEAMAYFPNAEKVILPAFNLHNETMSAFRERMRPEYKVVWTVYVTKKPVRTDQEVIHSSAYEVCFIDELSQDLIYCEDAIVVDVGHSYIKNIEWVKGMPKLKYLILTHNWVKDLTPLSTCKELIYLELYWNDWIPDYTPLQGCTALKDLNVSGTFADPEPLLGLTWLENLWANRCNLTEQESRMLEEGLPNTKVVSREGMYTGGGWRDVERYFEMRDIMGLPYNHW